MTLKDWFYVTRTIPYRFAKEHNLPLASIYRSMKGESYLSRKHCEKIEAITGGQVSREEALWPLHNFKKKKTVNEP